MKDKVLSVEQINKLKSLGLVISNPSIFWIKKIRDFKGNKIESDYSLSFSDKLISQNFETYEIVPTLTFDDIFDLLPKRIMVDKKHPCKLMIWTNSSINSYSIIYEPFDTARGKGYAIFHKKKLLEAAYETLIWCIENGYVKTIK